MINHQQVEDLSTSCPRLGSEESARPFRTKRTHLALITTAVLFLSSWGTVHAATIQVTLTDTSIRPATMTVTKGETVNLNVVNRGGKTHNLVIPAFYIFTPNLPAGDSVSASFSPDKQGSFPYYSDTGGKPEPGLRGTIHVRP
ncbi:MAG: cupredoxin domain-containing protein [Alicyclobacillus sp.]|nr:cupredoxin domain-containing protein [Alicyclobacillus sp.]